MYVFRSQFPRHELVRPVQPSEPVNKDPRRRQQDSGFKRFFQGSAPASRDEQKAGGRETPARTGGKRQESQHIDVMA
jgi:hypothetical protein